MHRDTLNLISQLYDAVNEPELWNSFLDNLAVAMEAQAARMRMSDDGGNCYSLVAGTGHDSAFDEKYAQYYHKVDVFNPIHPKIAPGKLLRSDAVIPCTELRNTEIYNDFYRVYDISYMLGGNIARGDNMIARIGIHRSRSQGPCGEQEQQLLQELMPHLQRAFKLGGHMAALQTQLADLHEALYHSPFPLLLIDEYSKVAFINQRGEAVMESANNLSIIHSRLTVLNNGEQAQLDRLLEGAVATGNRKGTGSGGAMRLSSADGTQRYHLLITPYPDRSVSQLGHIRRICAAVFIHDSQAPGKLPADILKSLYGFTRAEIRLAEAIVEGLTVAEAAARFCVGVSTTRSQLRALFAKTNTNRQAELVKLLLGITQ